MTCIARHSVRPCTPTTDPGASPAFNPNDLDSRNSKVPVVAVVRILLRKGNRPNRRVKPSHFETFVRIGRLPRASSQKLPSKSLLRFFCVSGILYTTTKGWGKLGSNLDVPGRRTSGLLPAAGRDRPCPSRRTRSWRPWGSPRFRSCGMSGRTATARCWWDIWAGWPWRPVLVEETTDPVFILAIWQIGWIWAVPRLWSTGLAGWR